MALIDLDPQESLAAWRDRRAGEGPRVVATGAAADAIAGIDAVDYVLIDTAPGDVQSTEDAVAAADFVLIPTRAGALDLLAIDPVIELCNVHRKPFAFVLNQVQRGWSKLNNSAEEYLGQHGAIIATRIPVRAAYVGAMTHGKGPSEIDNEAAGQLASLWADIRDALHEATRGRRRR